METGNNLNYPADPHLLFKDTHVIFGLRYDGISVVVADSMRKRVLHVLEKEWLPSKDAIYLTEAIQHFLKENQVDLTDAESIKWYFSTSRFCLIPDIFYGKDQGRELLKNTCRLHDEDLILADFWTRRDIVSVYALDKLLAEWISRHFEKSEFAHSGYSLNALYNLQSGNKEFCFLQVSGNFAEFFIGRENQVIFYNQFPYELPEDLLYMVLFTLEQHHLIAPEVELRVAGKIQRDEKLFKLLSTYIGEVKEIGLIPGMLSERHLSTIQLRRNAQIIATL